MNSLYDRELVKPMSAELEGIGVASLTSADDVEKELSRTDGTAMVVVNSVCGCAAGSARPGVALALQHKVIPDRMYTVFAGVDREATDKARAHLDPMPPSSPSVALLKDGEVVFMLHRHLIEGRTDEEVAETLKAAFDEHCSKEGPSVPWEQVLKAFNARGPQQCGTEYEK